MSYARLYDFPTWSTRNFVQASLKAIFPERAAEIDAKADPGEYGLENYYCRAVCCFIFAMGVINDLRATSSLGELFYYLPSNQDKWIRYEKPDWDEMGPEHAKKMFGWSELDLVKFGVAGMPLFWKVLNFWIVFVPKVFLWWMLTSSGFTFLMETSGIVTVIMNSMAMTFILNLDELIFDVLTTLPVRHIMDNLEDYQLYSIETMERDSEERILEKFQREELGHNRWRGLVFNIAPKRLLMVVGVCLIFLFKYYRINCILKGDGSRVSRPMFLPEEVKFNPLAFMFGALEKKASSPFWLMPDELHEPR